VKLDRFHCRDTDHCDADETETVQAFDAEQAAEIYVEEFCSDDLRDGDEVNVEVVGPQGPNEKVTRWTVCVELEMVFYARGAS